MTKEKVRTAVTLTYTEKLSNSDKKLIKMTEEWVTKLNYFLEHDFYSDGNGIVCYRNNFDKRYWRMFVHLTEYQAVTDDFGDIVLINPQTKKNL